MKLVCNMTDVCKSHLSSNQHEEIDEEKLDELGHDMFLKFIVDKWGIDDTNYPKSLTFKQCVNLFKEAFKSGYRKAKEE